MPRKLKVFLDTSAILSGLNSPTGAAGAILAACFSKKIIPIISPQVIEEAERNIVAKFPKLTAIWKSFLLLPPLVTKSASLKEIAAVYKVLPTNDAPILASAIKAKPDALITWDTNDFLRLKVIKTVSFPILTPGDFLNKFLK